MTILRLAAGAGLSGLLLFFALAPAPLQAAERIPVADFARPAELYGAKLSPDGKLMGYVFRRDGVPQLAFLNIATRKAIRGARDEDRLYSFGLTWVGGERALTYTYQSGLAAVDGDGTHLQRFPLLKREKREAEDIDPLYPVGTDPKRVLLSVHRREHWKRVPFPDVVAADTLSGEVREEVKNPGNVRGWLADWNGHVRYGLAWDALHTRLLLRDAPGQPWHEAADLGEQAPLINLVGADENGSGVYLSRPDPTGQWALYHYDLKERRMEEPVFRHALYDILPDEHVPEYQGVRLTGAVFSPRSHTLVGVSYVAEVPRQYWFHPVLVGLQKTLDELHPEMVNFIVNMDASGSRFLVLSWSDRDPGFYSLVDLATRKVEVLGHLMPWIKPEQMAPTYPIECKARDGLPLHGYLTVPLGAGQKNLPTVMLVHGGPWVRDVWGYDPVVQFLANRGYAVLQINYRGSTGYGQPFLDRGRREIGGAIQDDIADAVRWAIAKGLADPKRVAIMGASYGGYSVAFALAKTPELYRCGVDVSGVSDWLALFDHRQDDSEDVQLTQASWADLIGDLSDSGERQRLAAASPVNFASEIKAPLLVVHGKWDENVPLSQATALVRALKHEGQSPQTLFITYLGHSWPTDDSGEDFYARLETFLAKHMAVEAK